MLTQTRLRQLLRYDKRTGVFYWRIAQSRRVRAGARAGKVRAITGYRSVQIDSKNYLEHRLAWLYVYGQFPNGNLDHKNRIKTDNQIANLREATKSQNGANAKTQRDGLKGASRQGKWWYAFIRHYGKQEYLGCFRTEEAAHAAYCKAAKKLHGKFFFKGT